MDPSRRASMIAAGGELLSSSHVLSPGVLAVTPAHVLQATGTCRTTFKSQEQRNNERRGTGSICKQHSHPYPREWVAEWELIIRAMVYHLLNPNLDLAVRQKDSGNQHQPDPVPLLPPWGEFEEEEERILYNGAHSTFLG